MKYSWWNVGIRAPSRGTKGWGVCGVLAMVLACSSGGGCGAGGAGTKDASTGASNNSGSGSSSEGSSSSSTGSSGASSTGSSGSGSESVPDGAMDASGGGGDDGTSGNVQLDARASDATVDRAVIEASDDEASDGRGCNPACSGATPLCLVGNCVACLPGAIQCSGNTPHTCGDAGAWQALPTCGGTTPVCSKGLCGSYRSTGGIRSTVLAGAADAGIYLVFGGFEMGARSCNQAGVCVTGGIVP